MGSTSDFCSKDDLRTAFALSISSMCKTEVPLYSDLVEIVRDVNHRVLDGMSKPVDLDPSGRLDLERHGAIRLGSAKELSTMRRLLAVIGLYPVGYYDLSAAGLPVHGTAFRPLTQSSLSANPFRLFTTVLRPELLQTEARDLAVAVINERNMFSKELLNLIEASEIQGGLTEDQGQAFVSKAMATFRWQGMAWATLDQYEGLRSEHPILADIACFGTAHINHLTPRTLDIDQAQQQMRLRGMAVKSRIEGPPPRQVPILLRQTSFLALEECVRFRSGSSTVPSTHKARFGEIEQRGAAVTKRGRKLYDEILSRAMEDCMARNIRPEEVDAAVVDGFAAYPDTLQDLVDQGLIYCVYSVRKTVATQVPHTLEELLNEGVLEATPQIYEDFLPLSAAGIFLSNLGERRKEILISGPDQAEFEEALGVKAHDADAWYLRAQQESLDRCALELGIEIWREC